MTTLWMAFRARAGAAPLKHLPVAKTTATPRSIPRPRGRGPVEADFLGWNWTTTRSFRARAGAAPLKHYVDCFGGVDTQAHSAPARARPR